MQHRGPDGAGYELYNNNCLGFGHRRLSILDLSGKNIISCINNQTLPEGNNYHIAYLGNLSKGIYILKLISKSNCQSIKFIR